MRRSVLRPGWHVTTGNPEEEVDSPSSTVDYARLRAARLSKKLGKRLIVWEWNPANGLRRVRASAEGGMVRWHKPCRFCNEQGCDDCELLGSVVDQAAPIERAGDAL